MHAWLPTVIQSVEPWMSAADFEKGARWGAGMAELLEESEFGVLCVTEENLSAPWLLFESGALYKTVGRSFVCPYLLGLEPAQLTGPLAQFQAAKGDEQGTLALARSINNALSLRRLGDTVLATSFARSWPELEATLASIAEASAARPPELIEETGGAPTRRNTGSAVPRGHSDDYQRGREFYWKHRGELARDYAGEYVAIIGSDIVDHDEDFSALARRVFESGGVRPVFMPKLDREERTIRMPSPRVRIRQ